MVAHGNFVSSVTLLDSIAKLYSSIKELEPNEALEKQLQLRYTTEFLTRLTLM